MLYKTLPIAIIAAGSVASPVERQTACSSYTIISTRGSGEAQGDSIAFQTMNSNVRNQQPGGTVYNTVDPADWSQNSAAGTEDIINQITNTLASNSNTCFILEGYSQGAAATVNAMPRLTGNAFDAVKGVFLVGNPTHKAGLACNVDNNGGDSTKNVNGLSVSQSSIPDNWVSKTTDVCNFGDGVCDTTNGAGINAQHLAYGSDANVQNMGTTFILQRLRGATGSDGGSPPPTTPSPSPTPTPTSTTPTFPGFGGFPGFSGFTPPALPAFTFPAGGLFGFGRSSGTGASSGFSFPRFGS